jgi:hypothetical protein
MKKSKRADIDKTRALLDDPNVSSVVVANSKDGETWTHESAWIDGRGDTVFGHVLESEGQTYTITVETLSKAYVTVRAASPEQALEWAKAHSSDAVMLDDPPEYDWPTAEVEEHKP